MLFRRFVLFIPAVLVVLWWLVPTTEIHPIAVELNASSAKSTEDSSQVLAEAEASATRQSTDSSSPGVVDPRSTDASSTDADLIVLRLVDDDSGQAIAGATIHRTSDYGPTGANEAPWKFPSPWTPHGRAIAVSDASGIVHVKPVRNRYASYEIHADGYGPTWLSANHEKSVDHQPSEFRMQQAGSLSGSVMGPVPGGFEAVSVGAYVFMDLLSNAPTQSNFLSTPIFTWKTPCDANGWFELSGLPSNAPLLIWIELNDARTGETQILHLAENPLTLKPGQQRPFDWTYSAGHWLEGFALAANSSPKQNWEIWAIVATEGSTQNTLNGYDKPLRTTKTDDKGFFRFEDLPRGRYLVGPKPPWNSKSLGKLVEVPYFEALILQDSELGFVEGIVTCEGQPIAGMIVGNSMGTPVLTDQNGAFKLSGLTGDDILISTFGGPQGYALPGDVRAHSGDVNVRIEVSKSIPFKLSAVADNIGDPGIISFCIAEVGGLRPTTYFESATGSQSISNLSAGRYVILATSPLGLAVRSEVIELEANGVQEDIVLHLTPAGLLLLRGLETDEYAAIKLRQGGALVAHCVGVGSTPQWWIPPGLYDVEIESNNPALTLPPGTVSIAAGQTTSLTVHR